MEPTLSFLIDINKLYPTESLVFILPEHIENEKKIIDNNEENTCITAFEFEGNYYIVDGHSQLLAAACSGLKRVRVFLLDPSALKFFSERDNIISTLASVGMSTLFDFEAIGGFTYPEYPVYYKS